MHLGFRVRRGSKVVVFFYKVTASIL